MNAFRQFHTAVKQLTKPKHSGAEVVIEWRIRGRDGTWSRFDEIADYHAADRVAMLNRTDRLFEYRISGQAWDDVRKAIQ